MFVSHLIIFYWTLKNSDFTKEKLTKNVCSLKKCSKLMAYWQRLDGNLVVEITLY